MKTKADLHTTDTAPEKSKPFLAGVEKSMGMVPNMMAAMAASPALLKTYNEVLGTFGGSSLSPAEQDVVFLTASRVNGCEYCVPAHTVIAHSRKTDEDLIARLRSGAPLQDDKLQALCDFTAEVVEKRGHASPAVKAAFFKAGYTPENAMDVLVGVAHKVMSNYLAHIFDIPLDKAFEPYAWEEGVRA